MRSRPCSLLGMAVLLALLCAHAASGTAAAEDDDGPDGEDTQWIAVSMIFCIGGLWLVGLVFWIWLLTWVYRDANSRGMSGTLWVLIILALGLLGIMIYIIARAPLRPFRRT